MRKLWMAVGIVAVLVAAACQPKPGPPVFNDPPPPPGDALLPAHLDCSTWRYAGLVAENLPGEWDADDYRFGSFRDSGSARSPHRLCGQLGAASDLSWNVSLGRPDVLIAVIDSGIKWHDPGAMADLATKAYLNRGELPVPEPAGTVDPYDSDGDGTFNISDYGADPRVADLNGNGLLDPEDLILSSWSDGTDEDGNGYVDDISGWDVLNDDNNPLDDVDYGHGTGEARDSTAAHDGKGAAGTCPRCQHLPVRVSDSFIAEGGRFAAAVLFALDSGADVVQEALGAVSNPPQAQMAIDAAYTRGVPVVASMADEQSQHANLPAVLDHTIPVNSLTEAPGFLSDAAAVVTGRRDALALNGCTNHGGITWVSVPSGGCSSEATGNSAGMVGLVESTAREHGVVRHPDLVASGATDPADNLLSANEVAQVLRASADDVDFSTPNAIDPANEATDDFGQARFPTVKGWDATTGYGRINAYGAVAAVAAGNIPPEADISSPGWFEVLPTSGTVAVTGRVAAVRSTSYDYRVEWAVGLQTAPHPATDTWHVLAAGNDLTSPVEGTLATLDLVQVAAALPDDGTGTPTDGGRPDPDRFTVRVRVVVTDAQGRVGTQHRHVAVHNDPTARPVSAPTGLGTSSPVFHDLDGDGAAELVAAGDDGRVHALRADGSSLPGWPVQTGTAPYWHADSPTALAEGIPAPGSAALVGAPAIGDLDGDGSEEVVVADVDGTVHIWAADGSQLATMSTNPAFSQQDLTDEFNRLKPGFLASAALGDLDGDSDLEVVGAAADRHVYAWHHDGTAVAGFPVLVVDGTKVSGIDPASHVVEFADAGSTGIGGELITTPAIGDLDGDGRPEIVVGAQEQYTESVEIFPAIGIPGTSGNTRLYAISPDGTADPRPLRGTANPHDNAYLPGWPVKLPMLLTDVLPTIGDGVATQAAIGDVDGDGANEVVAASASGQVRVLDGDGTSPYQEWSNLPIGTEWFLPQVWGSNSTDTGALVAAFSGPALGDLGSATGLDIAVPTTGLGRALDTLLTNDQVGDPHMSVWSGQTGTVRAGFPRATADLAFFVTPAIADVDGDGRNDVVAGNGVHLLDAFTPDGTPAPGWPKFTGGWTIGTPSLGDWDGDGTAEVAVVRRDGVLQVWNTPTPAADTGDWVRFGGGPHNAGTPGG